MSWMQEVHAVQKGHAFSCASMVAATVWYVTEWQRLGNVRGQKSFWKDPGISDREEYGDDTLTSMFRS